jgi:F-type H+-transporting ATPase subunit delta
VQEATVAHKYARAVFDSALEDGNADAVGEDLVSLHRLERDDPAFLGYLISPEVLTEHKLEFVERVFRPRVSPLTAHLLRLLVEKARIGFLSVICEEYRRLAEEHRGILRAEVRSAVPLSPEQDEALKAELNRISGKNVVLEKRVDASVLAGVIVHLGNQIIDRSLRHGIRRLRDGLMHVEVN